MKELYLGIDIGTYSSKGVLVDAHGHVVAQHVIGHQLDIPHEGWAEHDAKTVWWGEFVAITKALLALSGADPKQIKAVAHSALAPCLVCADEQGEPLHPAILYGIDTRAEHQQKEINLLLGEDAIFSLSGTTLSSQSVTPKIWWVKQHLPDVWYRTRYLFSASGYITFKLTGAYCLDIYDAIGYPGLFDNQAIEWHHANQVRLGIDKPLPELMWATQVAGRVTEQAALETGLLAGTPVLPGCADAASEALAAGVKSVGDTMMMFGSSSFFITRTPLLPKSKVFWGNHFLEPDTYIMSGGTATCGSLLTWFLEQFAKDIGSEAQTGQNPHAALMESYYRSQPGANGLLCLPYFAGERTPILDSHAKGTLIGLTLNHTRDDVYRAVIEGIAMSVKHNIEALRTECDVSALYAVGGGVKNRALLQCVSDMCQVKQFVSSNSIGASYGNCIMAAVADGQYPSLDDAVSDWVLDGATVEPGDEHPSHKLLFELFLSLYQNNQQAMAQLSEIREQRC